MPLEKEVGEKVKLRIVITNDGEAWFVRRVRITEHDIDLDEKVYRCDAPIGVRFDTLDEAVKTGKRYLAGKPIEK